MDLTALSDLDYTSESVAYDIEGVVTGQLFTGNDDGVRPFSATIDLDDADLAILAADGNLHIEFTPSAGVDDFHNVDEYVTVGLTYEIPPVGSSVAGTVWADVNADGVRDFDEPGMPGVRVFLDDDNNGQLNWADGNGDG